MGGYKAAVLLYGHPIRIRSDYVAEHTLVRQDLERARSNVIRPFLTGLLVHNQVSSNDILKPCVLNLIVRFVGFEAMLVKLVLARQVVARESVFLNLDGPSRSMQCKVDANTALWIQFADAFILVK